MDSSSSSLPHYSQGATGIRASTGETSLSLSHRNDQQANHWSSWISGPLSTIVSSASGALSTIKGMASAETKEMNVSLMGKLKACDSQLDALHKQREDATHAYDRAVLATKAVEAKYQNNLKFIQDKLNDLRVHMVKVIGDMATKASRIQNPGAKDDDIIETFHSLVSMVDLLKTPAGTQFSSLFPHIAMDGVKVSVDYSQAVAMNKTILQEVAAKRDEEGPLLKRLEEIKHEIKHVQREVDLIREFQMKHARISADQVAVPMVDGAPKPLIGDDLTITSRSSRSEGVSNQEPMIRVKDAPFPPPLPSENSSEPRLADYPF